MAESPVKLLRLISSDKQVFNVEEEAILLSETLKHLLEDGCANKENGIPLPNVDGNTLAKVIQYCSHHHSHSSKEEEEEEEEAAAEKKRLDDDLMMRTSVNELYDLLMAADYLSIKGLLDLTMQTVVNLIKGKTVEEIRSTFNIQSDFSPEEEAELRKQYSWAFD